MPIPTAFHERTSRLCTSYKWKEWAGHYAVRSYDTIHDAEYFALRHAAGMLDISPLFKYEVRGPDAGSFLAWVMARDISQLKVGRVTYSCLCDGQGKVIDDGTIARLSDDRYRVTTASPAWRHLESQSRGFDVTVDDVSATIAALAIQGPTSRAVMAAVSDAPLDRMRYFRIDPAALNGVRVEISRTGYTGDLGYEVWAAREDALVVWDTIERAGEPHGLLPVGLDALDMTRIEAGYVLQDVDYFSAPRCAIETRKSSPFEIGLEWTVDLEREPFVGQAALQKERRAGSPWCLVGLESNWQEIEEVHDRYGLPPDLPAEAWRTPVPVYHGRRQVGRATSGVWSPTLKKNIALASVESRFGAVGTRLRMELTVEWERHTVGATVVERPFFDPPRKRAR